jgi:hypothetical protein
VREYPSRIRTLHHFTPFNLKSSWRPSMNQSAVVRTPPPGPRSPLSLTIIEGHM